MLRVAPSCYAYFLGLQDLFLTEHYLQVHDKASYNVIRIGFKLPMLRGARDRQHGKIC